MFVSMESVSDPIRRSPMGIQLCSLNIHYYIFQKKKKKLKHSTLVSMCVGDGESGGGEFLATSEQVSPLLYL